MSLRRRAVSDGAAPRVNRTGATAQPAPRRAPAAPADAKPAARGTPFRQSAATVDAALLAVLTLAAVATRVYRIAEPARIVFDEYHFSQFVDDYAAGRYLFDIHPPLAKLALFAAAKAGGYAPAPGDYKFDHIGKLFGDNVYVPQRLAAAAFGSLVPPTLYLTCRAVDVGVLPSLVAAVLSLTDTLLLIESRLVLTDSQLIFYIQAALYCAISLWRTPKRTSARRAWLIATALFGGCAMSTKWTALVAPGMIALVSLTGAVFPPNGERLDVAEMVVAGVTAVTIYVASFYAHFSLLPLTGPGDMFMPCWFRRHLAGQVTCATSGVADLEAPSFFRSFLYLNMEMYRANSQIETRHHWEAAWYEWVVNARGVLYLDEYVSSNVREKVYLIVNPVLAPVALFSVVCCGGWLASSWFWRAAHAEDVTTDRARSLSQKSLFKGKTVSASRAKPAAEGAVTLARAAAQAKRRQYRGIVAFFLAGYALNLLPYAGVKRCTFIYHYLPSLQFAIILAALSIELLVPQAYGVRALTCILIITASTAALWVYAPWVYALPRTSAQHQALQLMPRWD